MKIGNPRCCFYMTLHLHKKYFILDNLANKANRNSQIFAHTLLRFRETVIHKYKELEDLFSCIARNPIPHFSFLKTYWF